jgi:hypothetical protein
VEWVVVEEQEQILGLLLVLVEMDPNQEVEVVEVVDHQPLKELLELVVMAEQVK